MIQLEFPNLEEGHRRVYCPICKMVFSTKSTTYDILFCPVCHEDGKTQQVLETVKGDK